MKNLEKLNHFKKRRVKKGHEKKMSLKKKGANKKWEKKGKSVFLNSEMRSTLFQIAYVGGTGRKKRIRIGLDETHSEQ